MVWIWFGYYLHRRLQYVEDLNVYLTAGQAVMRLRVMDDGQRDIVGAIEAVDATSAGRDAELAYVTAMVSKASAGDEAAWRELISLYSRRVYALCRGRCKDHDAAEEITQSVFVTVAQKVSSGEYGEEGRFESWLFRIAANRVRDHIRRLRHRPSSQDPDVLDVTNSGRMLTSDSAETEASTDRLGRLRRAMEHLGETDREVVELRHHAGLSFKQIADLLGEPLGTLLARHHRALKKMKELIGEWERGSVTVKTGV